MNVDWWGVVGIEDERFYVGMICVGSYCCACVVVGWYGELLDVEFFGYRYGYVEFASFEGIGGESIFIFDYNMVGIQIVVKFLIID